MGLDNRRIALVIEHYKQLHKIFSGLEINETEEGRFTVTGNLGFTVTHDGKTIKDDYDIEIIIPDDYPDNPPMVKETGNRIPRDKDNHVYPTSGTLCLGAPVAVRMTFAQQRNLLWFVKEQVVRFLFSHSYKRDYGVMPFGELRHDSEGILDYYKELFAVKDNIAALEFLRILSSERYDDYANCPCGSGLKIKKCHYRILKKARKQQRPEEFYNEFKQIMDIFPYL